MAKLPNLTGKEVGRIAEKLGFVHDHTNGSHMLYIHADGRKVVIPHHAGQEIGPGLLNKIMKKHLGISREELQNLM